MILFEEPHLKIEFKNVPCRHLVTTWGRHMKGQQYRDGINTILKCCRENEIRKVLSDIRHQEGVDVEDENYAADQFRLYVDKHGFFFQALILPGDVFVKFSAANFDRKVDDRYNVNQYFSSDKDAINWLMQVDL